MRRRLAAVLAGAPVALVACNALTGASDLGVGGASSSGGDPAADGARAGEGGANRGDGAGASEGGAPAVTPSLAACGANRVCLTNAGGWAPAVYVVFDLGRGCPPEWPERKAYEKSGGGSCACHCTPTSAACAGPIEVRSGGLMCTGGPTTLDAVTDGGCTTTGAPLPSPASLTATGLPPQGCSAQVEERLSPPDDAVTCSGATSAASPACDPGEVCVPKPTSSLPVPGGTVMCIAHDGDVACPNKLPMRVLVGTTITDQRTCSTTCTCAPSTCTGGKLDAFKDTACTDRDRTFDVNGTCTPGAGSTATSFRYTPPTGCAVKQAPQVLGTETVQSPRTFCCTSPSPF
jgi:hypothetical protein